MLGSSRPTRSPGPRQPRGISTTWLPPPPNQGRRTSGRPGWLRARLPEGQSLGSVESWDEPGLRVRKPRPHGCCPQPGGASAHLGHPQMSWIPEGTEAPGIFQTTDGGFSKGQVPCEAPATPGWKGAGPPWWPRSRGESDVRWHGHSVPQARCTHQHPCHHGPLPEDRRGNVPEPQCHGQFVGRGVCLPRGILSLTPLNPAATPWENVSAHGGRDAGQSVTKPPLGEDSRKVRV